MTTTDRIALALLSLILATLLALWAANADSAQRATYRALEHGAEAWHGIDDGILDRVAFMESRRNDLAPYPDGPYYGCTVSRYGLYLPFCTPVAVAHLEPRATAIWAAARWLAKSKRWCAARPGVCPCPWARWNWNARDSLCGKLMPTSKGDET